MLERMIIWRMPRTDFFYKKVGGGGVYGCQKTREGLSRSKIFRTKAATKTILAVAVVLTELNECLAVGSMSYVEACSLPAARNVIVLSGKLL